MSKYVIRAKCPSCGKDVFAAGKPITKEEGELERLRQDLKNYEKAYILLATQVAKKRQEHHSRGGKRA